ncbi:MULTISPECIES: S8 family serine peptidase [unclassified Pseudoalteromonas]|uniref:S8 family serine peptidase n=1 Tax=unclassified Pseudoalteromonas TaxID=194690 RepID=UPI003014908B
MKKLTIAALITGSLVATSAYAEDFLNLQNTDKKAIKVEQADFGAYKVLAGHKLVSKSIANPDAIVGEHGEQAIVKSDVVSDKLTEGALVKNIFNGTVSTVSGNINVLLEEGQSAKAIASQLGLKVEKVFSNTGIVVFDAKNHDVLSMYKAIKQLDGVKAARIEVRSSLHEAR